MAFTTENTNMIYMASEGDAVKNELSLLACLEAKRIYDKLEDILPDRLSFIYGILDILWSRERYQDLFTILKGIYILVDLDKLEYFKIFELEPDTENYFLNELMLDLKEEYDSRY